MKKKIRILSLILIFTFVYLASPIYINSVAIADSSFVIKNISGLNENTVILQWDKVKNAKSYDIYRAAGSSTSYKKIKSTTNSSYKNSGLKEGKAYSYKVKVNYKSGKSAYSKAKKITLNNSFSFNINDIKEYSGKPYAIVNNNIPYFTDSQKKLLSFEYYASLDSLGRCRGSFSMISKSLMPKEERGSISGVKPSGWQTIRYDNLISDKYLYNRCHLIGYQLTGENANEKNLVTGTRYLNIEGMLPFENEVADYIKSTGNKVLYRATPIFVGDELVCRGILMEGYSVKDKGKSICFNVFCYNVQPGITINYADGSSFANNGDIPQTAAQNGEVIASDSKSETNNIRSCDEIVKDYILNTNTKKYHKPDCPSVNAMKEKNKRSFTGTVGDLKEMGYDPCGNCQR